VLGFQLMLSIHLMTSEGWSHIHSL